MDWKRCGLMIQAEVNSVDQGCISYESALLLSELLFPRLQIRDSGRWERYENTAVGCGCCGADLGWCCACGIVGA